jgi:phosphohistidine swiveling domain-containing protein
MVEVVLQEMGLADVVDDGVSGLSGTGVGNGVVVGRARVAETAEDAFDLIEDGDILVTRATSPAYSLVLTLVDGLVTSEGGPMSHAAVLSRELGISAIVGASSAMTAIKDGEQIKIDPAAGTVQVLSEN